MVVPLATLAGPSEHFVKTFLSHVWLHFQHPPEEHRLLLARLGIVKAKSKNKMAKQPPYYGPACGCLWLIAKRSHRTLNPGLCNLDSLQFLQLSEKPTLPHCREESAMVTL